MPPLLTILTDPVPIGPYFLIEPVKQMARTLRNYVKPYPPFMRSKYRGHFTVTRSLVEGLKKIGVSANYNPSSLNEVAEVVVVLSSISALKQAIKWKKAKRVNKLIAGPNLVIFPSDHKKIISSDEIDICITPSQWTCDLYVKDCPELAGRCVPWPAGVDTGFWRPNQAIRDPKRVLVYEKSRDGYIFPVSDCLKILKDNGYQAELIRYGHYSKEQYLALLQSSNLMIAFSASESQGVAWAEAWSTNVPTLILNQNETTYKRKTFKCSSAPYLTHETGMFFNDVNEFRKIIETWETKQQKLQPREWVLENMSDEVCARKLCELAGVYS